MISKKRFSQKSQESDQNLSWGQYQWSDSETGVHTVGIYVENHHNRNRDLFIWIRFDNMKLGEKESLALLLEDLMVSETCSLEESASHHKLIINVCIP